MRSLGMTFVCAALSACTPDAGPRVPSPASPTAPAALPTATPTPSPSVVPSPADRPLPTPSPCPDGTPPSYGPTLGGHGVILVGVVLDPAGAPVEGALAHVVSLDAMVPYQATALTGPDGRWVVNNLPADARVRCRASEGDRASADVLFLAERTPPGCRERRHELVLRLEPPLPPPSFAPGPPAR